MENDFPAAYARQLSHLNKSGTMHLKTYVRRFYHICSLDAVRVNGPIRKQGLLSRRARGKTGGGYFDTGHAVYVSSSIESCILQNAGARRTQQGLVVIDIAYNHAVRVKRKEQNAFWVQKAALSVY